MEEFYNCTFYDLLLESTHEGQPSLYTSPGSLTTLDTETALLGPSAFASSNLTHDFFESNTTRIFDYSLDPSFWWSNGQAVCESSKSALSVDQKSQNQLSKRYATPVNFTDSNQKVQHLDMIFECGSPLQYHHDALAHTYSEGSTQSTTSPAHGKMAISQIKHINKAEKPMNELYQCGTCDGDVGFRYEKDLKRHMQSSVHNGQRPWFCPLRTCKFGTQGFSRKDKAVQHIRTHRDQTKISLAPIWGGPDIAAADYAI